MSDPADPTRRALTAYFDAVEESRGADRPAKRDDPTLRRIGKYLVPPALRVGARVRATDAIAGRERRKAAALVADGSVRLHLGSGAVRKEGWVNVDLLGDPVDLAWNLLKPFPFPNGSVEAIFSEHFLTLFPHKHGVTQLAECHRVLQPGGVLRVAVPDPWKDRSELAEEAGLGEAGRPALPRLLAMQEVFYYPGNRSMYDRDVLELVLRAVGFGEVEQRQFGSSRLEPSLDSPHRQAWTIYVEAVK